MTAQFFPVGYEDPSRRTGFMKFKKGDNKMRILSNPILGWEEWIDTKPIRYRMKDEPKQWQDPKKPGKHFVTMMIWDYKQEEKVRASEEELPLKVCLKILHIPQVSIRRSLEEHSADPDLGPLFSYDIEVKRSGEGLQTKYGVFPLPPTEVPDYIIPIYKENRCNLEAIFDGQDPWGYWDDYTKGFFEAEPNLVVLESEKKDTYDEFISFWSISYDKNLLEKYIEKRSEHFGVSSNETVALLAQDQDKFEIEFKNWSEKQGDLSS